MTIGTLVLLEGLLSADNALVLALLVRHLPGDHRKRALKYGLVGAFGFRLLFLIAARWLIGMWIFKLLGGAYLLYVGAHHFITHRANADTERAARRLSFWQTVIAVELTDVAFSVDSILAAVALSNKLWVVYLGGISGIVAMRFVAGGFLKLIDQFPTLTHGAYALVVWIGVKLTCAAGETMAHTYNWSVTPHLPESVFWIGMVLIAIASFLLRPTKTKRA